MSRAAVVALALLTISPAEADWCMATTADDSDRAAVCPAATLAFPITAVAECSAFAAAGNRTVALAVRRLKLRVNVYRRMRPMPRSDHAQRSGGIRRVCAARTWGATLTLTHWCAAHSCTRAIAYAPA